MTMPPDKIGLKINALGQFALATMDEINEVVAFYSLDTPARLRAEALEAEIARLNKENQMLAEGAGNTQRALIAGHREDAARIEALEEDNKRLREALRCSWKLIEQINEFGRCVDHEVWEIAYDKVSAALTAGEKG